MALVPARDSACDARLARAAPPWRVQRVATSPSRVRARAGTWLPLLGACGCVRPPSGRVDARGSSPVRVAARVTTPARVIARGSPPGAWLRLISLADDQAARERASGLRFRRGLVLELRLDERNTLV